MQAILELAHLTKRYWDFTLDDISLVIPRAAVTGILGASGAGKTTLIRSVMNLVAADGGQVRVFGMPLAANEKEIKNRIGYVGEEQFFPEGHTAEQTGRLVARFFERWNGSRFTSLLEDFGIESRKRIKELSRGRRTLLALAIALSHEADLLLLDEATAGLDVVIRRQVLGILRRLVDDEEKTVVLCSHNTEGLTEIADEVAFLDRGRLVLHEATDDLFGRWKWIHYRAGVLGDDVLSAFSHTTQHPFASKGLTSDFPSLRELLAAPIAAGDVRVENADLGDILVSIIEGA